jgi:F-type H+-transporting ATPase subunit g
MRQPFTTAFRPFLRQSAGRRFASTNSEGTQKKAQDALGSVQKNAEKAWETTKKALGPFGEKAGNMLGCECQKVFLNN